MKLGLQPPTEADIIIDRALLKEMALYAQRCPADVSNLTYTETQQLLTLYGLVKVIESYGIACQFEIHPELIGSQ